MAALFPKNTEIDWIERKYSVLDKGLTIALAASIVVTSGTLAYVVLTPRPGEAFTEFYILGPGGNASGYPKQLNVSQNGTVILGIANYEHANVNYTVRVDLVGVRIVYNSTARANETVEVNRTTWSWFNVTLGDGANWTHPYPFSILKTGLWTVHFVFFKDGDLTSAHRRHGDGRRRHDPRRLPGGLPQRPHRRRERSARCTEDPGLSVPGPGAEAWASRPPAAHLGGFLTRSAARREPRLAPRHDRTRFSADRVGWGKRPAGASLPVATVGGGPGGIGPTLLSAAPRPPAPARPPEDHA